ncbi:hypothetical protein AB835_04790 [Candidatus Endobugula sertula]|uniref:Transposase-like Mu C-terminal domain-containing protein n=1 Tax=Candidatus Endobugula sertula TaxID=62101 RepID=A0A1D2QRQ0_9GAMM|nr:hypothetical protein AB835_04790 [Candidatus Endobugula sertula]
MGEALQKTPTIERKVTKSGIYYNGAIYGSYELWEHLMVGDEVQIVDESNGDFLHVFMDGKLICEVYEFKRTRIAKLDDKTARERFRKLQLSINRKWQSIY